MKFKWMLCGFLPLIALTGCLQEITGDKDEDPRLNVWVSIPPQTYFIHAVGGDEVKTTVMVPAGTAPENFVPDKAFKERISHADLVFGIGVGFEKELFAEMDSSMSWVGVVDTRELMGYDPGGMRPEQHLDDPHLWMDPVKMIEFATLTYQGLSSEFPRRTLQFKDVANLLIGQLRALHDELYERFRADSGRVFYINHPSLGHFARRYGLEQRAVRDLAEPRTEQEFAELVERARTDRVGAIFIQPEFGRKAADALSEALGVPAIEIDVLAADYVENLREIGLAIDASFSVE